MELTWHILFIGVAFFQMLFMAVQWIFFRRKEYFYYIGYIAAICLYILFRLESATGFLNLQWHQYVLEIFDQPMIFFSYWMYVRFAEFFLSVKNNSKAVYKYSRLLRAVFLIFIILKVASIPFGLSEAFKAISFAAASVIMLCFAIPLVINMIKQKYVLNNFLLAGSFSLIVGGLGGMIASLLLPEFGKNNTTILLGVEIGVLMELFLLNTGFMLKNKILQQQVIKGQQKMMEQLYGSKEKDKND